MNKWPQFAADADILREVVTEAGNQHRLLAT